MVLSTIIMSELGDTIRAAREAKGWSGRQLANYAEISNSALKLIEDGVTEQPTQPTLARIADKLDLDPKDLYRKAGYMIGEAAPAYRLAEEERTPNYHIRFETEVIALREAAKHHMNFDEFLDAAIRRGVAEFEREREQRKLTGNC